MDRLNLSHSGSRVELPSAVDLIIEPEPISARRVHLPVVRLYGALLGFMTCGAAVIATASLLAMHVQ